MTPAIITVTAAQLAKLACQVTTLSGDTVRAVKDGDNYRVTGSGNYVDYTEDLEFAPLGYPVPVNIIVPGDFQFPIFD